MTEPTETPPRGEDLLPGYDDEDPYENENIESYPAWWHSLITEFREHGLRPYRPPQFADGTLVPPTVSELEDELDVTVRIRAVDPVVGANWEVLVDDEVVTSVGRQRNGEGRSVYGIDATTFERTVREALEE